MYESTTIITIPAIYALSAIVAVVFALVTLFFYLSRKKGKERHTTDDPDWSIPTIDAYGEGSSFFHTWDPRIKIAALFLFCFIIVSLQKLSWIFAALAISLVSLLSCEIPLTRAVRRLAAMSGFLTMFLIILPITVPPQDGETIIIFTPLDALPFHISGLMLALKIVVKACAIALLMEPLLATAPFAITLHGLSRLGVPDSIIQMILLSHRYLFVFLHEIKRMHCGMRIRGFRPATNLNTMHTMGNFFGMLFVRSFDRTQRVYDAMLSRGYHGRFPTFSHFETQGKDWAKGVLWIMLGVLLIILDRFVAMN